ncbi:hypothetical protein Tco_0514756 [Tanacetum coccineum]
MRGEGKRRRGEGEEGRKNERGEEWEERWITAGEGGVMGDKRNGLGEERLEVGNGYEGSREKKGRRGEGGNGEQEVVRGGIKRGEGKVKGEWEVGDGSDSKEGGSLDVGKSRIEAEE